MTDETAQEENKSDYVPLPDRFCLQIVIILKLVFHDDGDG